MAQLQWNQIQGSTDKPDYVSMAKEFIKEPELAFNISQNSSPMSPEDYFDSQGMFDKQMGMWDKMNQQQDEINQLREHYQTERENWLNEKESLINSSSTSDYINGTSTTFKPSKWTNQDSQGIMYQTMRDKGLDHNQALGLLMNVQAENDFGDKYVFGTHQDGSKTAYGALSWQGGREAKLLKKLASEGLFDPSTKRISQSERALQIQAEYMIDELKSGRQGNYLGFTGKNPLDYARMANKTYTRSSQDSKVLAGREKSYKRLLQNRDWNNFMNQYEQRKRG